ncbi:MAG: DUF423 domain-containing protein [Chthoniobacterales bacterium]
MDMNLMLFRLATILCFLAVALGAFGAHALKATLTAANMAGVWEKAVLYHLTHAIALLALSLVPNVNRPAAWLLLAGIALFSGSLYLLALTGWRGLGAITPLGGLCFLAAWVWLAFSPVR